MNLSKTEKSKILFDYILKQNNLELVSDYIDTQHKVKIKCNICKNEWEVRPNAFSGSCKFCNREKRKKNNFSIMYPGFTLKEKNNREMTIQCNKCKTVFKRIRFRGVCPECNKELIHKHRSEGQKNKIKSTSCYDKLSLEEYKRRLYSRRDDLEVISDTYSGSHKNLKFRCTKCNREFEYPAYYAIVGKECPYCYTKSKPRYVSNLEDEVANYIKSIYNGKIIRNTTFPIYKELDIYIPDMKVAIEVNGTYWHSHLFKSKSYHIDKSKRCEAQGIRLIHVWEYEWFNERQRPILENIIKNALGLCDNKIYARKCKIKVINRTADLREFFDNNNVQGFRPGKFAICLEYNDEIVMSYIFGHCYFGKGKYECEVIRGATKLNYNVIGRS